MSSQYANQLLRQDASKRIAAGSQNEHQCLEGIGQQGNAGGPLGSRLGVVKPIVEGLLPIPSKGVYKADGTFL